MNGIRVAAWAGVVLLFDVFSLQAQEPGLPGSSAQNNSVQSAATANSGTVVPRLVQFNGVVTDASGKPATGTATVTFSLYEFQDGGHPLWSETQTLSLDSQGHYTAFLGAASPDGLPLDLFATGSARWLGIAPQVPGVGELPRVLLVGVPYAMKAADADTLSGLPASAFVQAGQGPGSVAAAGASGPGPAGSLARGSVSGSSAAPGQPNAKSVHPNTAIANYLPYWNGTTNLGDSAIFQSGSNIGVGTTTPLWNFQLVATNTTGPVLNVIEDNATTGASRAGFTALGAAGAVNNQFYADGLGTGPLGTPGGYIGTYSSHPFAFFTGNVERLRVTASGLVGIGTKTPGATLEVNGTSKFDQAVTFASGQLFPGGTFTGSETVEGNVSASGELISTVAQGTAPLQVTSTTQVANLNVSLLGGLPASAFQPAGSYAGLGANTFSGTQTATTGDLSISSGDLDLPATTSAAAGVINLGGVPFLHACCPGSTLNTFVGKSAGNFTTTGTGGYGENTAIGYGALSALTTGFDNTASGANNLDHTTTGEGNTATGDFALSLNTTGGSNTASGTGALYPNTTGGMNTAIGWHAGQYYTGTLPSTGSNSTFIGASATATVDGLTNATAIGYSAQVSTSNALVLGGTGGNAVNVGIGTTTPGATLEVNGTAKFDQAVTFASGQTFPGGTFTGSETVEGNVSASGELISTVAQGTAPLQVTSTTQVANLNVSLLGGLPASAFQPAGSYAGLGANTFSGNQTVTGNATVSGQVQGGVVNATTSFDIGGAAFAFGSALLGNSFLGFAGNSAASGNDNTATGVGALGDNTTGYGNVASGTKALYSNTTGWSNIASGVDALGLNTTGNNNVASGNQTLFSNATGDGNTGIGGYALQLSSTGFYNTGLGYYALSANTAGSQNTALGYLAGANLQGTLPTTGSNSTFVGANATATVDGLTNATTIGACATVSASNALVLGMPAGSCFSITTANTKVGIDVSSPSNIFTVLQGGGHAISDGWDVYSSRRWKSGIEPLRGALGKVERLRGVSYTYNATGKRDIGMIAEEVGKVVPEVVSYEDNGKDARGIDYARLTALLVEAVKQQQKEVQQQVQIKYQQSQIWRLQAELRSIEARK